MVIIYDCNGKERFRTPINKGSRRFCKLMGDDYITLKFSVANPIYFKVGDYTFIDGDFGGLFEIVKPYQPTYNQNTGGYDYELRLDAQHIKWRNKIMRFVPDAGGSEVTWSLTATAAVHLSQIVANVNALAADADGFNMAYRYNRQSEWASGGTDNSIDASAKTIQYDQTNILDALNAIAETFECEWWTDGNRICLGKREIPSDYIDLELGINVSSVSRSDSTEEYVTRILAFGSERNISPRYRKDLIFDVTASKCSSAGRWRILDSSRILNPDWVNPEQVSESVPSGQSTSFALPVSRSGTAASTTPTGVKEEVQIHTASYSHPGSLSPMRYRIALSEYLPNITLTSRTKPKTCATVRVEVLIKGRYADGAEFDFSAEDNVAVKSLNKKFTPHFADAIVNIEQTVSSISVTVNFYAVFFDAGTIAFTVSDASGTITAVNADPSRKLSGLTVSVIDKSGNVAETIGNCVLNPDFAELWNERSWIELPQGHDRIKEGARFRLEPLLEYRVKSSYFSSRYSAYDEMANVVKNGVVTNRLMLPQGVDFVDYTQGLAKEQGVEDVVIFEDIYPRALCTVTDVREVQRKETVENDDGTTTERSFTAFRIADNLFGPGGSYKFKLDYIISNKTIEITFQDGRRYKAGEDGVLGTLVNPDSGKLNGWTFEAQFVEDPTDGSAWWEIVRDNEAYVPNEILRPCVDDQFALSGIDISVIDGALVLEAEKELLEAARRYVKKHNTDASTYDCTMLIGAGEYKYLQIGRLVNLINPGYTETTVDSDGKRWGRKSRVIGFEIQLDCPFDNPVFTIGEKPAYSRLGAISDRLDALRFAMDKNATANTAAVAPSGTDPVYVIGQVDTTPASDTNVFSALRSRLEFASRKAAETIGYLWKFTKGICIGNYVKGGLGAAIDADGKAEVETITSRKGGYVNGELYVKDGGITVGDEFVAGSHGGRMWEDEDGNIHLETDYLSIRKKFSAKSVEIQEETHVGGCQISSPAAMRCSRVIPIYGADEVEPTAYKCFFLAKDSDGNAVYNQFAADDLARCETFNLEAYTDENGKPAVGNRYYWRVVTATGTVKEGDADFDEEYGNENFIVLSNLPGEKDAGSMAPMGGDRIITVGNRDKTLRERQNIIVSASYDVNGYAPYIRQYKGIDTFKLSSDNLKTQISPTGNIFTGEFRVETGGTTTELVQYVTEANSLQLVLTDEFVPVYCYSNGNPKATIPDVGISVVKSGAAVDGYAFTLQSNGCSAKIADGQTIEIASMDAGTDSATITVTATKKNAPTLTATVQIVKVFDGVQGSDAVVYTIEPDAPVILADINGDCDPAALGCEVYKTVGNQARASVAISQKMRLTYTVTKVVKSTQTDADGTESTVYTSVAGDETDYGYPIATAPDFKSIHFRFYADGKLCAVYTVTASIDTRAMQVEYSTLFNQNKKAIEAEARRISANETGIANLTIKADAISSTVTRQTQLGDYAGRNLLLGTNQGCNGWMYSTDSAVGYSVEDVAKYPTHARFITKPRTDGTWEVFLYRLRPEMIVEGEKYILSFTMQNYTDGNPPLNFYIRIDTPSSSGALTDNVRVLGTTKGHRRISALLTAKASGAPDGAQCVYIAVIADNLNTWQTLDIWDIKLERVGIPANDGDVPAPTPYTAAPEDHSDINDELLKSTIEQTAERISLKVDGISGYSNLIGGNDTGAGWSLQDPESGVYKSIVPTNGKFAIVAKKSGTKIALRSAAFNLAANTKYVLQFKHGNADALCSGAEVAVRTASEILLTRTIDLTANVGEAIVVPFVTSNDALNSVYVEFCHLGVKSTGTSTLAVYDVMVEVGEVAHDFAVASTGLLATGIDITSRRITFTADNFLFRNNDGEQTAFIDSDGHILAKYIKAEELTVGHVMAGDEDGQHIEIRPDTKTISITDAEANERAIFSGVSHHDMGEVFITAGNGAVSFVGDAAIHAVKYDDLKTHVLEKSVDVGSFTSNGASAVKFSSGAISLFGFAGYDDGSSPSISTGGLVQVERPKTLPADIFARATAKLYLDTYSDSSRSTLKRSELLGTASANAVATRVGEIAANGGTIDLKGRTIRTASAGFHVIRLFVEGSYCGNSSYISAVPSEMAASFQNDLFASHYFANGLCIGTDINNYVAIFNQKEQNLSDVPGMYFKANANGYGVAVMPNGLRIRHHGGVWKAPSYELMHVFIVPNVSGGNVTVQKYGLETFDGSDVTVVREGVGEYRISFPDAWKGMNLNNSNIRVCLTPFGKGCQSSVFMMPTPTYISVYIVKDAAPADASFSLTLSFS